MPQARQGVFDPFVWLSEVCFLVFLRGPQPSTRISRTPIVSHFSHHFFGPVFDHNWCQNVQKWEPQKSTKSHKSRKMTSRAGLQKKDGKSCEKVHFSESWICNPLTPVQSKHTFSFSRSGRKSDPKSLPKAPQNRPKSTKNRFPSPCKNSCQKSCHTKRKKCSKVSKKGPPMLWHQRVKGTKWQHDMLHVVPWM